MEVVERHRSRSTGVPGTLIELKCGHSMFVPGRDTDDEKRCEWCERRPIKTATKKVPRRRWLT